MRKPRPQDYTRTYQPPASPAPEALDMRGVVPIRDKPYPPPDNQTERFSVRKSERRNERTDGKAAENTIFQSGQRASQGAVTVETERRSLETLPLKRRTKRYSFEFYEDQLVRLKQLKIDAEMAGESLSLSDMVRRALDAYLHDKVS